MLSWITHPGLVPSPSTPFTMGTTPTALYHLPHTCLMDKAVTALLNIISSTQFLQHKWNHTEILPKDFQSQKEKTTLQSPPIEKKKTQNNKQAPPENHTLERQDSRKATSNSQEHRQSMGHCQSEHKIRTPIIRISWNQMHYIREKSHY